MWAIDSNEPADTSSCGSLIVMNQQPQTNVGHDSNEPAATNNCGSLIVMNQLPQTYVGQ